jgi:hypothetical protein
MQLRSKRAEHQTANPFLSLSLSLSLIFHPLALKREKAFPFLFPFLIVSEIFNKFSACFPGFFFL